MCAQQDSNFTSSVPRLDILLRFACKIISIGLRILTDVLPARLLGAIFAPRMFVVRPAGLTVVTRPVQVSHLFEAELLINMGEPFRILRASKIICSLGRNIRSANVCYAPSRIRTCDPLLKRQVLYQLSYGRIFIYCNDTEQSDYLMSFYQSRRFGRLPDFYVGAEPRPTPARQGHSGGERILQSFGRVWAHH